MSKCTHIVMKDGDVFQTKTSYEDIRNAIKSGEKYIEFIDRYDGFRVFTPVDHIYSIQEVDVNEDNTK